MYPLQPSHPVPFSPFQPSNKSDGTKNCVQQTSRSPPWGMENGLTLHIAQQKLILFIPAEQLSVPDTEQLVVTSGFVPQRGLVFGSPCMVQIFTQNQHGLWMLLLRKIGGF